MKTVKESVNQWKNVTASEGKWTTANDLFLSLFLTFCRSLWIPFYMITFKSHSYQDVSFLSQYNALQMPASWDKNIMHSIGLMVSHLCSVTCCYIHKKQWWKLAMYHGVMLCWGIGMHRAYLWPPQTIGSPFATVTESDKTVTKKWLQSVEKWQKN